MSLLRKTKISDLKQLDRDSLGSGVHLARMRKLAASGYRQSKLKVVLRSPGRAMEQMMRPMNCSILGSQKHT